MQKIDLTKVYVTGGWTLAPHGAYWLTDNQIAILENGGFKINFHRANVRAFTTGGTEHRCTATHVYNFDYTRATPSLIRRILGHEGNFQ